MRVVFFGTPLIAAEVLNHLLDNGTDVVAVITKPDRAQGRSATLIPTPVKCVAQTHDLPVYQPELVSSPEFAPILEDYQADLFIVFAYGEIIKQHLLDMPKIACINLHASLLPKYRGAAPIQRCLINGETKTGLTIIHMVKKMDAGDIINMVKVPVNQNTTAGELEELLCTAGKKLLLQTICSFENDTATRTPQNPDLVTFAPKIEQEDCQINWALPANNVHNLVRGLSPHPGAWCFVNAKGHQKRLKILKTVVVNDYSAKPGSLIVENKHSLAVACGKDTVRILEVQLEGKKAMTGDEFMHGFPPGTLSFYTLG
jgi:methionyl-tRNA formyltransferase